MESKGFKNIGFSVFPFPSLYLSFSHLRWELNHCLISFCLSSRHLCWGNQILLRMRLLIPFPLLLSRSANSYLACVERIELLSSLSAFPPISYVEKPKGLKNTGPRVFPFPSLCLASSRSCSHPREYHEDNIFSASPTGSCRRRWTGGAKKQKRVLSVRRKKEEWLRLPGKVCGVLKCHRQRRLGNVERNAGERKRCRKS